MDFSFCTSRYDVLLKAYPFRPEANSVATPEATLFALENPIEARTKRLRVINPLASDVFVIMETRLTWLCFFALWV